VTTIKVKLDARAQKSRADWIEFATKYSDLFFRHTIGYWAFGKRKIDACGKILGWVVEIEDPHEATGKTFTINRAFAARAFDLMVAEHGCRWYERADASRYDEAIQLAAFGKRVFA
jgi:hypothetical protein